MDDNNVWHGLVERYASITVSAAANHSPVWLHGQYSRVYFLQILLLK